MLPIVVVLLAVTSVLAAPSIPSVSLSAYNINEIGPPRNVIERAFEQVDSGAIDIYSVLYQQTVIDLSNLPDAKSRAVATGQALVTLAQLSTTIPGDACAATAFIDVYLNAVNSGNFAGVRPALNKLVQRLSVALDFLGGLVNNPESLRNSVGPGSGCAGGGRSFPVEQAWDVILSSSSVAQIGILNEQYCAVKRLNSSFNSRSNSIAATATALALPPVTQVFEIVAGQASQVLNLVANGANPVNAIANLKQALRQAPSKVQL